MMTWYEYEIASAYHQARMQQEAAHDHLVRSLPRAQRSSASVRLAGHALCLLGAWLVAAGNRLQTGGPAVAWEDQGY